ncbi:MAG: outer membrane protein assembly factor BamA [Candidatus Zixiibacteriota bacterium]|nr:MAG: outer membrane protein assembly factor BamA [candidate division Zixibacteria bacterium]
MPRHRAWIALLVAVMLLGAGAASAQQSFNVVDIEVEGNRVASKSLILGVSSVSRGSPLTPVVTAETIRRLYGLGIFSDVRIEAEEVMGGIKVYIVVEELPKLAGLNFEGNKKIKTDKMKEDLKLGVGGYISPNLIQRKKNEIRQMYAEKGYFQAAVQPSLEYSTDSAEAVLTFRIDEKSKVKVEQVVMTGNVRVPAKEVIGKMRNRKRGFLKSSDFAKDKYEEDLEKVVDEFHKKGHIDAYLVSDSMTIDTTRNRMTIYLDVYEGPRYYFGEVAFASNQELSTERLRRLIKFDEGEVFDSEKYDKTIEEIYSAYYDIGHLNIRMYDDRVTRSDSIIDITYEVSEGLPSHVNLVNIVGNTKTKDKVIRREISMLPGLKFSRALLIRSVRDVMALNFFGNVEPVPINLPSGDVDIEFRVEEKQTGSISAGAGYNSQDKIVGNLSMGIPNFRGMGQNLGFSMDFGSRRNSFSISFTEPWLFGRPTLMGADIYTLNRRWFTDYTEGRQGGLIRLGRRLRWPDNYFRVLTSYRLERARYYDYDDDFRENNSFKALHYYDRANDGVYDSLLAEVVHLDNPYPGSVLTYGEQWNTASRIAVTIVRDSRNLPEFATSGSKVSYTFENTGGIMGGFWKYQKHTISVAKFFPLFWRFALAAKLQYGVVTSPAGDDRILLSDRFTPGGTAFDGIVRGYDDGILTPDSIVTQSDTVFVYYDSSAVIGEDEPDETLFRVATTRVRGKYMLVGNLELQFPVIEQQVYLLAFYDAGNSWLHRRDIMPFRDIYKGAGLGFRIVVPGIGTLGFDFGYAFDSIRGSKLGWKPHFQIGTTFR